MRFSGREVRHLVVVLCHVGGVSLGEVWALPGISSLWVAWRLFCEGACTGLPDVVPSAIHTSRVSDTVSERRVPGKEGTANLHRESRGPTLSLH